MEPTQESNEMIETAAARLDQRMTHGLTHEHWGAPEVPVHGYQRIVLFARLILSIQRSGLSRNAKAVLSTICGLVDWTAWQRQFPTGWIARRAGVSEDTVARALPELRSWRLLDREDPPRSSPIWQVRPAAILELEPERPSAQFEMPEAASWVTPREQLRPRSASGAFLRTARTVREEDAGPQPAEAGQQLAVIATQRERTAVRPAASSVQERTQPRQIASRQPESEAEAHNSVQFKPQDSAEAAPHPADTVPQGADQMLERKYKHPDQQHQASPQNSHARRSRPDGADDTTPLSKDAMRFRQILERWSGPEAPAGRGWRVHPNDDVSWYQRELISSGLTEGLDMDELLTRWDEFLETAARGQKNCKFPVNFKNSLRNQIALWSRWWSVRAPTPSSDGATVSASSERETRNRAARANLPVSSSSRYPTREEWHTDENGNRRTMSYAEHVARAQRKGTPLWPRNRFDAFVRENGLEPVD